MVKWLVCIYKLAIYDEIEDRTKTVSHAVKRVSSLFVISLLLNILFQTAKRNYILFIPKNKIGILTHKKAKSLVLCLKNVVPLHP